LLSFCVMKASGPCLAERCLDAWRAGAGAGAKFLAAALVAGLALPAGKFR